MVRSTSLAMTISRHFLICQLRAGCPANSTTRTDRWLTVGQPLLLCSADFHGSHFLQEDSPDAVAAATASFVAKVLAGHR